MAERSLLPGNATALERSLSLAANARMGALDVEAVRRERQPQTADAAFLPLLAFERSVHFWRAGDDAGNSARIASSFSDHGAYGSPVALANEIALDVGWPVIIREFWQFGGVWPAFRVVLPLADDSGAPPSADVVKASANARKNVRDLLDRIVYAFSETGPLNIGAAVHVAGQIRVEPYDYTPTFPGPLAYGAAVRVIGQIQVEPHI